MTSWCRSRATCGEGSQGQPGRRRTPTGLDELCVLYKYATRLSGSSSYSAQLRFRQAEIATSWSRKWNCSNGIRTRRCWAS